LLLEDKETKEITILDHKSANLHFKKNGEIGKKDSQHFLEFKRQLYLYSKSVMEEYNKKVSYLSWNLFRINPEFGGKLLTIPWAEEEYQEALGWAIDTISKIENEMLWLPDNSQKYWCNNICSYRNVCDYR